MGKARAAVLMVLAVVSTSAFGATHPRKGWYIGFGIGAATGSSVDVAGSSYSFNDLTSGSGDQSPNVSVNFKVGGTLTKRSLLGFDFTASRQQSTGDYGGDFGVQINNYLVMYTFFPMEQGLFLRAGAGLTSFVSNASGFESVESTTGYGGLVGLGYGFWLGKRFNLTLNLDYSQQKYSGGAFEPDKSKFTAIYLGFDWY